MMDHMSRKPKKNAVTSEDAELFRSAIGAVRELKIEEPATSRPKLKPHTRMAERDEQEALSEFQQAMRTHFIEAGDTLSYRQTHITQRTLKRLARGEYAVQDEIDLHGCRSDDAKMLFKQFLNDVQNEGFSCVRIIHGKGLHSKDSAPQIKNLVDQWLRQRHDVLAFHSAPANQGGVGAVLVLLRPH